MTVKVFLRKAKNFFPFVFSAFKLSFFWFLANRARFSPLRKFFPKLPNVIWRFCGVKLGKNVVITQDVYFDVEFAKYITIEDNVGFGPQAAIFAHRRVMDDYHAGGNYWECPQKPRPVHIKKGAFIGIRALITPGVTIGEGAVIGAGSVVVKDIPDWCLAAGSPCKVMRYLPKKGYYYNKETKQNEPIPGYEGEIVSK